MSFEFEGGDPRVEEAFGGLSHVLDGLDDDMRDMTAEMLHQFCWCCVKIRDLEHAVEEEGLIVVTDRGARENPAVGTMHKLTNQKAALYSKVVREVGARQPEAVDELRAFAAR